MSRLSRRRLLQVPAVAAAACVLGRDRRLFGQAPAVLRTRSPNSKLNTACVAVGGRGGAHVGPASSEQIIAICDVDEGRLKKCEEGLKKGNKIPKGVKCYTDYRKLFDELGKELDAVFVATPDHNHAAASLLALKNGIACYTEKPCAWSVAEAKALAEAAAKAKVATQMGNQGHAGGGIRKVVEWIRDGAIGEVKEVYTWTNRPIWPQGITQRPESKPVPKGLDWENWIGPAPFRDYHDGLHSFAWRGWQDFGCGAIGDMGCHTWDNVFWSMNADWPTAIELLEINGPGGRETFPKQSNFKWEFPARGGRAAFTAYWMSGGLRPPVPEEMLNDPTRKGKKVEMPKSGNLYIGSKGKLLVAGDYADSPRLIPETSMKAWQEERKGKTSSNAIEGSPGHHKEFLMAAKGEKPWDFPKSNFTYAGPLTEVMLLGAIAEKIGKIGFRIECDAEKRVVKTADAAALVGREYRKGWSL